jgi:dTDP-glucose 4,6-dehydratase
MANILVTGGAGFIGSNFILYWLAHHPDDSVWNVDKLTYAGNVKNLASVANDPRYHFLHADINDKQTVDSLVKKQAITTIVHFAAETHVDRSLFEPQAFVMTNVMGTQSLLDIALANNLRFHHVSTDEVFGAIGEHETRAFTEETAYAPRSPYSASKAGADHLVRSYHISFGLPVTITNCSNNYGPRLFPEKLISLAITNLLEGKRVPVYGTGLQSRDWLYVEDHVRAIEAVLERGKIGETYCVGGMHTEITNLAVVETLCRLLEQDPKQSIEFVKDRPGHDFKYVVDWSKIRRELGWEPKRSFEQGLAETVEWYKQHEAWWKEIKSGAYREYYEKQYKNVK